MYFFLLLQWVTVYYFINIDSLLSNLISNDKQTKIRPHNTRCQHFIFSSHSQFEWSIQSILNKWNPKYWLANMISLAHVDIAVYQQQPKINDEMHVLTVCYLFFQSLIFSMNDGYHIGGDEQPDTCHRNNNPNAEIFAHQRHAIPIRVISTRWYRSWSYFSATTNNNKRK